MSYAERGSMAIRWLGHAAFLVMSPEGVRVLTDPFDSSVPYPPVPVECDVVTVSHEHHDHNGVSGAKGSPKILRGLEGGAVAHLRESVGDVRFWTVSSFHDAQGGAKRGANAIFVMDVAGLKVVHLGDLGHLLSDEATSEIGPCDVLLAPVGGHYTIEGKTAAKVTRALNPKVVIPMHFKTQYTSDWPIGGPEEFISEWSTVKRLSPGEVFLSKDSLPEKTEVWIPAV